MATTPLYYRKVLLITFSLAFMLASNLVETRTFPRTNSRSFRFPSSAEEHSVSTLNKESSLLFVAKAVRESNNLGYTDGSNQGRNAVITLDSNPIKAVVPQSPERPKEENSKNESTSFNEEETVSTEILEGDLGISAENHEELDVANDDSERNDHNREDETLREALCASTTNSSVTTTNAKLRYDLHAGKCAEVGNQEHCGRNMIFVAEIDSSAYGYCECDFENRVLRKEAKQSALFTRTPLVYHSESKACYRLYEQGYCNDGEWLVLSRERKGPVCEPKRCPAEKDVGQNSVIRATSNRRRASKLLTPSFWTEGSTATATTSEMNERLTNTNESATGVANVESIWVALNGTGPCVKLFAKNLVHCEADETVMFRVGDIVPKCGIIGRGIEGRAIIRNACPPGSYYSIIGRCQPDWDF